MNIGRLGYLPADRTIVGSVKAIAHEQRDGDYKWGAWLAVLRRNADLIELLIDGLNI